MDNQRYQDALKSIIKDLHGNHLVSNPNYPTSIQFLNWLGTKKGALSLFGIQLHIFVNNGMDKMGKTFVLERKLDPQNEGSGPRTLSISYMPNRDPKNTTLGWKMEYN